MCLFRRVLNSRLPALLGEHSSTNISYSFLFIRCTERKRSSEHLLNTDLSVTLPSHLSTKISVFKPFLSLLFLHLREMTLRTSKVVIHIECTEIAYLGL